MRCQQHRRHVKMEPRPNRVAGRGWFQWATPMPRQEGRLTEWIWLSLVVHQSDMIKGCQRLTDFASYEVDRRFTGKVIGIQPRYPVETLSSHSDKIVNGVRIPLNAVIESD